MSYFQKLRDRLVQKFVRDPAGYGRPVPTAALDHEYRSGHWDHFFAFSELPRNLVLAGAINHFFPREPAVLDVGCGSGRLATVFQRYPFARYLGADVSAEGVARAQQLALPRMEFVVGNYETWRPEGKFDAIAFNECIGYASDPAATLQAFSAHLNPGGRFFLSHFRFGSYAAQWRRMAGVCDTVEATAVSDATGQRTWDIKVLRPPLVKRVLIVSPHFPPINAPDCQRVRMSLPYYRKFGWDPVVIAAHPSHRPDWRDESLLAGLPADVPIHYTRALPLNVTRWLGIQNIGLRCLPFMSRDGYDILQQETFDLVFFSTTQYLVTPLGRVWQRSTRVPYVIDLQDPWRNDYYERAGAPPPPGGWKYQFARFTAWMCEEATFRRAAGFISVSHHYFKELAERYPWFAARPRTVIPFAGPQADFDYLRQHPAPSPIPLEPSGCLHWVAAGSVGPSFSHALRVLFAGLKKLRNRDPQLAARIRLHFVGTSYAPRDLAVATAKPIAEAYGVGDLVREIPTRIGYLDSLRLTQAADGLLLLGSDDLSYSPSKIYPNCLTGRPILALAHHGSLLAGLVDRLRCGRLVTLLEPGRETEPSGEVAEILGGAAARRDPRYGQPVRDDTWFHDHLLAEAGAERQCAFFDVALDHARSA